MSAPSSPDPVADTVALVVDGREVTVMASGSLLDALRDQLGNHAAKDGCSPQGQCGCCTVLVDGAPRVACVTPVRRVRGRTVTTATALDDAGEWADAFCATGASQCGFCTPGIVTRLSALRARKPDAGHDAVEQALLAHLCRCTGWRTILDAWERFGADHPDRDLEAAGRRATMESGGPQRVGPEIALGEAGFVDDTAPAESLVAVLDPEGAWTLGESVAAARSSAGKVQGRRTTAEARPPIELPAGDWDVVLQTSWVEPGYLEPDASWAEPGGAAGARAARAGTPDDEGATRAGSTADLRRSSPPRRSGDPLANGGAFGGKVASPVPDAAGHLSADAGRPVRALYSREDVVRRGPKRPPMAAGLRADGSGVIRVSRTAGVADAVRAVLPDVTVEEVDVPGPPTSLDIRAAGWAEAVALRAALRPGPDEAPAPIPAGSRSVRGDRGRTVSDTFRNAWVGPVTAPGRSGQAWAQVSDDGSIAVRVDAGDPLDEVVLRSYCIGAAHQAASWVTSESLTVDDDGEVHDLTVRSFGILRAVDTPPISVEIEPSGAEPVPVADAVFAAVAAAVWLHQDTPPTWPTAVPLRRHS